ncbi:hypothetical protein BCR33DRAFT_720948 [Rhizoclosmatium globosum]|uniref:CCHC-type domain-containing protein n=1 Tax=Rhizoclosmatium globosum TaxID=329046 RepID=A0A1Y2BUA0_9FUNG|nr:hypothetical protein BCR33DRAFT_720948 [Rhizoclosmatium globosum]|eukprot:ORY38254.1 hypothetical protein BCR33DRAFT_720948 [Rhizoclosmatium globosum]
MDWTTFRAPTAPVAPPNDPTERDHIHAVAQHVASNPPEFLYLLMQKESQNPLTFCRFLWPNSPSYPYFAFKVWSYRNPTEFIQFQTQVNTQTQQPPVIFPLDELATLLKALMADCTKTNIQSAKSHIFKNHRSPDAIKSVVDLLLKSINDAPTFQQRLHVLYLVNEILFNEIQKGLTSFRDALAPTLTILLRAPMAADDIDSSKLEKIHKVNFISLAQAIGNPAQRHPTAVLNNLKLFKPIQRQPEYQNQPNPAKVVEREKPLITVAQVRPGPPKLYYELPAGLMCLKVPIGSMYYDSLSVNSFNSLPPPKPISNISQILKDSGWETGLIDSVLNERFVERKQNPAFSKRNEEQQRDGYSSDGSASDSDNDSGNRKRKRSLTPERRWQGDRRAVEPGACFRCGKQGHIAKYCDDFKNKQRFLFLIRVPLN